MQSPDLNCPKDPFAPLSKCDPARVEAWARRPKQKHRLMSNPSPTLDLPWGSDPSPRYAVLAACFRPLFARIREGAVERDLQRRLPYDELGWLKEAGFTRLRLPIELGGGGVSLTELFALLLELGAADTNVVNALRAHFGFAENVIHAAPGEWRTAWMQRLSRGEMIGSGFSEAGDAKQGSFGTRLIREPGGLRLSGQKFYTTGSIFADWINTAVTDEEGETVMVAVPRAAPGADVIDDWNGFGQALSGSGTATFVDVSIEPEWVTPAGTSFTYAAPFYQLVHVVSLAGIGRAQAEDLTTRVRERERTYSNGNATRVANDPQILQVVGRVRSAAYAARAIALQAAAAVQRAAEAVPVEERVAPHGAMLAAHVEVDQAVSTVTHLVLGASTELFDALGASAALQPAGLDRYWRNARTLTSHNPRIYRERQVGDFAVNGAVPPTLYRVGKN